MKTDVVVVGAGLVGLAAAYAIKSEHPQLSLAVVEKEPGEARHQSGHNSGVIHSGIYYKPGSLKAQNCREGKALLEEFCAAHGIKFRRCGKVIVAVTEDELPALENIYGRGQSNGVRCEMIGPERLKELEPYARGIKALYVPETGVVDFTEIAAKLRKLLEGQGTALLFGREVQAINSGGGETVIITGAGELRCRFLVNCAGLQSDRIMRMEGSDNGVRIVPFRGEYFMLKPGADHICKNLIYPVPDPAFPFLGVHLTRMIGGAVECGPNAVLGMAREAYRKFDIRVGELLETLRFRGFRRFARAHWRAGLREMHRSFSKGAFVRALQRLVPEINSSDLVPAEAGVRAQALDPEGRILDDFAIHKSARALHVLNAPSPAATSCLSVGKHLAGMAHAELSAI